MPPAVRRRPRLLEAALTYGASNVLQRAIPFLLLPVLTRYLSREDYGRLAVYSSLVAVAMPLVGLNSSYVLRRRFFDTRAEELARHLGACLRILALGVGGGLVVVALASGLVASLLASVSGLSPGWWAAAVVQAGGLALIQLPLTLWQVEHRPRLYAMAQVGRSLGLALLTLVAVVALGMGYEGALGAMLVTTLLAGAALGGRGLWGRLGAPPAGGEMGSAARFGAGLLPHALGALAVTNADRFFVTHYAGAAETGVYWVGYQFGLIVSIAADAFNRAFTPWLFDRLQSGSEAGRREVVRRGWLYALGIASLATALSLLAPVLMGLLLPESYRAAAGYVPWVAAGFAAQALYALAASFVFYEERAGVISAVTTAVMLCNLGLNALLVPEQGALGAARATAASFALGAALTWWAAVRIHPMPWLRLWEREP